MSTERGMTKTAGTKPLIKVAIISVAVLAIVVTALLVILGGKKEETPQSTSPSAFIPADAITYTVVFKNYDGAVIDTQTVEQGKAAVAPADPTREHFTFAGWDKAYDNVTGDLIITATYTTIKTVIYAEHVEVAKDAETVTLNVRILNNPGIMGAVLKISVEDQVLAVTGGQNTQYSSLTLTTPGPATTSSPYTFLLDAMELSSEDIKDNTLFTIIFKVKDAAEAGRYSIALSYDEGAIFDQNFNEPEVALENGSITIQ